MNADKGSDERGTMNDELKTKALQFIVHHSAFIVSSFPNPCVSASIGG
jgi:hypothetical protein